MPLAITMPGYARLGVKGVRGLAVESCHAALESILETETLYEHAARQPDAKRFKGRTTAFGITIGNGCGNVVVRHAMRGGFLARTGSDLFLPPTRGLRELINSLRLRLSGVSTPEVVAFVTYRAGPVFRRSDVATREIAESHDLAIVLREMSDEEHRQSCMSATGKLLTSMARSGAHHPDLNARNILITWDGTEGARAHVLDVDRIRFHVPGDPMVGNANVARLERSLRKLVQTEGLEISPAELETLRKASGATGR